MPRIRRLKCETLETRCLRAALPMSDLGAWPFAAALASSPSESMETSLTPSEGAFGATSGSVRFETLTYGALARVGGVPVPSAERVTDVIANPWAGPTPSSNIAFFQVAFGSESRLPNAFDSVPQFVSPNATAVASTAGTGTRLTMTPPRDPLSIVSVSPLNQFSLVHFFCCGSGAEFTLPPRLARTPSPVPATNDRYVGHRDLIPTEAPSASSPRINLQAVPSGWNGELRTKDVVTASLFHDEPTWGSIRSLGHRIATQPSRQMLENLVADRFDSQDRVGEESRIHVGTNDDVEEISRYARRPSDGPRDDHSLATGSFQNVLSTRQLDWLLDGLLLSRGEDESIVSVIDQISSDRGPFRGDGVQDGRVTADQVFARRSGTLAEELTKSQEHVRGTAEVDLDGMIRLGSEYPVAVNEHPAPAPPLASASARTFEVTPVLSSDEGAIPRSATIGQAQAFDLDRGEPGSPNLRQRVAAPGASGDFVQDVVPPEEFLPHAATVGLPLILLGRGSPRQQDVEQIANGTRQILHGPRPRKMK